MSVYEQIRSSDGKRKLKKRFPDFALHYLSGFPRNHDVDNLRRVTNHEELLQFSMGRFVLVDSFLLAICEIKSLPDPKAIPADETFQSVLYKAINTLQAEAQYDAQHQAGLYLSAKKDINSIVAIAAFGPHFSWRVFTRDAVTDVSSNEDPTFAPRDSDESDSMSDVESADSHRAPRCACRFVYNTDFSSVLHDVGPNVLCERQLSGVTGYNLRVLCKWSQPLAYVHCINLFLRNQRPKRKPHPTYVAEPAVIFVSILLTNVQ